MSYGTHCCSIFEPGSAIYDLSTPNRLITQSDGLTQLGRQLLGHDDARLKRDAALNQDLQDLRFQLEQIEALEVYCPQLRNRRN